MRNGSLLHRVWWHWSDALWPLWVWRPYCWIRRRHEQHYSACVFCGIEMPWPPAPGDAGERGEQ
jgi:hypothetical protein